MTDKSKLIAKYNDEFRSNLGNPHKALSKVKGKYVMSYGIANLEPIEQVDVLVKIRSFNDFTEANDPHGEHDLGKFQLESNKQDILWKIDYYDTDYKFGSIDASDLDKTRRVLTAMFACEY